MTIPQARGAPGLRVTDSPHWANWWAQSLRAVLHVKKIPYQKVLHPPFSDKDPDAQRELFEWSAQNSAPTMVYNDGSRRGDVVKNDWLNQLLLAEQIEAEPALIPRSANDRVVMVGLAHEIMSPQGLMWNGRLALGELNALDPAKMSAKQRDFFAPGEPLGGKYSHNAKGGSPLQNMKRCIELLDEQLRGNQGRGRRFFVGEALSALDLYWALASNFVRILSREELPIMRFNRSMYPALNDALSESASPRLLDHRDMVFREFLELPLAVD
jgi:glutathione S-transferase